MMKYKNKKEYKPCTKEDIEELGTFKHKCEDLIIISVTNANIPYPNSMVFSKKLEQIGKIDEVLGSFDDVYVSISPIENKTEKYNEKTIFYCDKRKLIPKSRFISRTDTEKIKEEKDKRKTNDSYKSRNNTSFNNKEGGYKNKTNDSYKRRDTSFNNKEGGYKNKTNNSYKSRNASFNNKEGRDNSINRNSAFQDKNIQKQFKQNSNLNHSSNNFNKRSTNNSIRNNDEGKYNLPKRDKPMNHNKDFDKRKKSE